jgi:hypothetical protein
MKLEGLILTIIAASLVLVGCTPNTTSVLPTLIPTVDIHTEGTTSESDPNINIPPTFTPQALSTDKSNNAIERDSLEPTPTTTLTTPPTFTPQSEVTENLDSSNNAQQDNSISGTIGTVSVDSWIFEITEVRSDRGVDPSRQSLVLLGHLTNDGNQTDTFVPTYRILVQDSSGRQYENDDNVEWAALEKYGGQISASINPGAKIYTAFGFDVPAAETSFTIVPGSLVSSWGQNVSFIAPGFELISGSTTSDGELIGTIYVNSWIFEITEVQSDLGTDSSRQSLVILGYLTNDGNQTSTFTPVHSFLIRDSRDRQYEARGITSWEVRNRYGIDLPASINPGARVYTAFEFDVPASETTFTIIPGILASSWGGNVQIRVR